MNNKPTVIEMQAELWQIKSMADGGYNVLFKVGEDNTEQIKALLDILKLSLFLYVSKIRLDGK